MVNSVIAKVSLSTVTKIGLLNEKSEELKKRSGPNFGVKIKSIGSMDHPLFFIFLSLSTLGVE